MEQSSFVLPGEQKIDWPIVLWFAVLHGVALIGPFFFFSWGAVLTAVVLYFVTGLFGITLGYHRLLTHRTFRAPKWVERTLATLGTLALQRSPLEWVAHHRMHHAFGDTDRDPHDARHGFWWSHMGWMCHYNPVLHDKAKLRKFARDVAADPYMMWLAGETPQIVLQGGLAVALVVFGGWDYLIWGGFVRTAVVYHITWFVNSATHKWGYKNYASDDLASNCWWVGVLSFGEGWHNNHHTYPDVAPAGHKPWEVDITWYVIKAMKALGLAWDVKTPPQRVAFERPERERLTAVR